MSFVCPVCKAALRQTPERWVCAAAHGFDVARQGYVNLLLVQQKHSRDPGDTLEALSARRAFLEAGHYASLRDHLLGLLAPLGARSVLDIGCGEGYYTAAMTAVAQEVAGVDIAKAAIAMAARRSRGVSWLVASSAALPVDDASVDIVCNLFCPLQTCEIRRVLPPGGRLLVVTPSAEHLWSVREALFGAVHPHDPDKFLAGFEADFDLERRRSLVYPLVLPNQSLKQLLAMTPYVWKSKPERRIALETEEKYFTQAAFSLLLFRKRSCGESDP